MAKTIDGFFVDPTSGAFQWVMSLLETHRQEVQNAIFIDKDQPSTDQLRGRYKEIDLLRKRLEQAIK